MDTVKLVPIFCFLMLAGSVNALECTPNAISLNMNPGQTMTQYLTCSNLDTNDSASLTFSAGEEWIYLIPSITLPAEAEMNIPLMITAPDAPSIYESTISISGALTKSIPVTIVVTGSVGKLYFIAPNTFSYVSGITYSEIITLVNTMNEDVDIENVFYTGSTVNIVQEQTLKQPISAINYPPLITKSGSVPISISIDTRELAANAIFPSSLLITGKGTKTGEYKQVSLNFNIEVRPAPEPQVNATESFEVVVEPDIIMKGQPFTVIVKGLHIGETVKFYAYDGMETSNVEVKSTRYTWNGVANNSGKVKIEVARLNGIVDTLWQDITIGERTVELTVAPGEPDPGTLITAATDPEDVQLRVHTYAWDSEDSQYELFSTGTYSDGITAMLGRRYCFVAGGGIYTRAEKCVTVKERLLQITFSPDEPDAGDYTTVSCLFNDNPINATLKLNGVSYAGMTTIEAGIGLLVMECSKSGYKKASKTITILEPVNATFPLTAEIDQQVNIRFTRATKYDITRDGKLVAWSDTPVAEASMKFKEDGTYELSAKGKKIGEIEVATAFGITGLFETGDFSFDSIIYIIVIIIIIAAVLILLYKKPGIRRACRRSPKVEIRYKQPEGALEPTPE